MAEDAVELYWPAGFQYPRAWLSQMYQESLCDPQAVSPAGAAGIAQFMPATWSDMETRFGLDANPHSDLAVEWGAYYQARMMAVWAGRPRPALERWHLGLASYNAGAGNIIAAQAECDGARDWQDIRPCLPEVTGRHAAETRTYVERTRRWTCEMTSSRLDRPNGLECSPR
ncbi:transglycosylase SLT domain-containing protein [Marinicauda sp. Alg238-R41]|uniref:transglycosylase SLT domain-containing protein n=1 Tax=Marinicauda sp. Alg238-R41 TaxID=2993447 RepID=UPI0022E74768|nr:transglycosylase SLT domain-containing protein [Marinicauda sp. Alg238-R41]